jgi:hypothetical protein
MMAARLVEYGILMAKCATCDRAVSLLSESALVGDCRHPDVELEARYFALGCYRGDVWCESEKRAVLLRVALPRHKEARVRRGG